MRDQLGLEDSQSWDDAVFSACSTCYTQYSVHAGLNVFGVYWS